MASLSRTGQLFDGTLGLALRSTEDFREGVRDSFGASIDAEVLVPILENIKSLRGLNEEFRRQAFTIDNIMEEARAIQCQGRERT
jgi:hypothetical protein